MCDADMAFTKRYLKVVGTVVVVLLLAVGATYPAADFPNKANQPDNGASTSADRPTASRRRVKVDGADPSQLAMVAWSVDQFANANLSLPQLIVRFHIAPEECRGFIGFYDREAGSADICNSGGLREPPRHTVLHELAHAWSFEYLERADIEAFLEMRALETWRSEDVAWWLQGQEQAAEIVAWGLMNDRPFSSTWTRWEPCRELAEAFELLTGSPPVRPSTSCDRDLDLIVAR